MGINGTKVIIGCLGSVSNSKAWSGSRWTIWFPKAHSKLLYITSIGLCFNKSIVSIIISTKPKRKLKENMSLRHRLELQTSVGRGCMRSQTLLSLKKDTLVPIKRNLKTKQDTSALQRSSKLSFQSRRETQGLLIIFFSLSTVPLTQGEATASAISPRSGTCVLHPTFQGAELYLKGWSLSHDSEHKCKPTYCRMSEGNQQQSMRHRACSSPALP